MTVFDEHRNLALGTVSAGSTIIGSETGTSLVAGSDAEAAEFPAVPFYLTVWRDQTPDRPAVEIMRATAFDGTRTFTVERAQQGTTAQAFITQGWKFGNTITVADILAIEDAVTGGEAGLAAEAAARESADAALQGNIAAEATARAAGDAATLSGAEVYADGKVSTEASARAAGDAATLASAEGYADGEVAAEAATRASADATLQTHIDSEATARASGDAATLASSEGYADGQVAAEASARVAGDAATLAAAEAYTNSGSITAVTAVKTSGYTANLGEFVPVDTTGGAVTITLPNAPSDGCVIAVKLVAQSLLNAVTVACQGSDVLNTAGGPTTATLLFLNQSLTLRYKASGHIWYADAGDPTINLVMPSVAKGFIYPPSKGDASVDANEIANAISLLPSTGGKVQLDSGPYDITNGFTIGKPLHIEGGGPNGTNLPNVAGQIFTGIGTSLVCSSPTIDAITVNADGVKFSGLSIVNTSGSTPTAGSGIKIATYGQAIKTRDCSIRGFYDLYSVLNGPQWWMDGCLLVDPVRYGIFVADGDLPDSTAGQISNTMIFAGPTHASPLAGIYWNPAGGLRVSNSKIIVTGVNPGFGKGIWMQVQDGKATSVFILTGTSIENVTADGVRVEQTGTGTGQFSKIAITGNHIEAPNSSGCNGIVLSNISVNTDIQYAVIAGGVIIGRPTILLNNVNGVHIGTYEAGASGAGLTLTGTCTRVWVDALASSTANRLPASAMRANSKYWDTTLNKLGIADGAGNWRDAMGTII